jgi:hypothetical protein
MLTWGDQQIPELVDEVVDIHSISYDRNRKDIMMINHTNLWKERNVASRHRSIEVLRESNIDHIRKSIEYWVKMAQEPHREIQEKWVECKKIWTKINRAMRDIILPKFGTPDDFFDLRHWK